MQRKNYGAIYTDLSPKLLRTASLGDFPFPCCVCSIPTSHNKHAPLSWPEKNLPSWITAMSMGREVGGARCGSRCRRQRLRLPAGGGNWQDVVSRCPRPAKAQKRVLFDMAIPRLGTYSREVTRMSHPWNCMLMAALSVEAKTSETYLRASMGPNRYVVACSHRENPPQLAWVNQRHGYWRQ